MELSACLAIGERSQRLAKWLNPCPIPEDPSAHSRWLSIARIKANQGESRRIKANQGARNLAALPGELHPEVDAN
ncbi:MAG: hypothetical protein ABJF10_02125 [Chthoniobacter sp.]|uniref:hypothetical protein n=1 Tax=Chthoniobacter sp. TaxID=2510640 RepID=UPI0032A4CFA3